MEKPDDHLRNKNRANYSANAISYREVFGLAFQSKLPWQSDNVDEHLRSISRMSAFFQHSPYETVSIQQILNFKSALREQRDCNDKEGLKPSTVSLTLLRCGAYYEWLAERPGTKLDPHLRVA
jgi:hypothetical protein